MGKLKFILGLAVLALAVSAGWQIGSSEIANLELQSDLRDISAQVASRIALEAPSSDDDLRNSVIHKAQEQKFWTAPALAAGAIFTNGFVDKGIEFATS